MKKFRFLLSFLAIAAFTSCEDYLDENNIANVTASGYYTTAAGLEDAVSATYGIMKEFYGPEIGWSMGVFGTDTYRAGADGSHKYMARYASGHNSEARFMRDTWRIFYEQVNQANAVIARAEGVTDMDASTKTQRIAEARFLRALAYFNLTRHYGDIHLSLEETQGVEGLDGYGHRGHLYFLMEYDKKPAMTRDTENGRPWKRFRPTPFLMSLWDRTMDRRYDETYKHVWYANVGNDGGPNGVPVKIGDTALYIPGPGVDKNGVDQDGYWNAAKQASVNFEVYTSDEWDQRTFPSLNKWIDNTRPNRQHTQGQRDYVLMRLADAYLIRAEARLKQGNTSGAASDINVIRTRAAWDGKEADMQITAADVDVDMILDERARELVGENHRWFDLTRMGKLVERVRLYNSDGQANIQDYHVVRPIPLSQIDRTSGGYAQNPGYAQ